MKKLSLLLLFIFLFTKNAYATEGFDTLYPEEAQKIENLLNEKKHIDKTMDTETMKDVQNIIIQETKKLIKTGNHFMKDIKAEKGMQFILENNIESVYYVPFVNEAKEEWILEIENDANTGTMEYNRHNIKKSLMSYQELAGKISNKPYEFFIVPFPNPSQSVAIAYMEGEKEDFIIPIETNLEGQLKTGEIYSLKEFTHLYNEEMKLTNTAISPLVKSFLSVLSAFILVMLLFNFLPKYIKKLKNK